MTRLAPNENRSYVESGSEKRDAVSTGPLEPTGKIVSVAVLAEHRDQGVKSVFWSVHKMRFRTTT